MVLAFSAIIFLVILSFFVILEDIIVRFAHFCRKSWIEKNLPTIYLISFLFCILTVICTAVQWRGDFNAWVQTRRFACETVNLSNKFQFSSEMIDECPNSFGCLMPLFYLSLSTTHWGKTPFLGQKSQF